MDVAGARFEALINEPTEPADGRYFLKDGVGA